MVQTDAMNIPRRVIVTSLVASLGVLSLAACGDAGAGAGGAESAAGQNHELVGKPGPDFSVDTANGQGKVSLSGLKGKVVIVDFWATWCDPCKKSFPKLQDLYTKYQASGLEIVGFSEDDDNSPDIAAFGTSHGSKFPLAWDDGKSVASQWKPPSMPSSFIVDRNGIVRFAHLGYHDGDEAEIEKELKSLL